MSNIGPSLLAYMDPLKTVYHAKNRTGYEMKKFRNMLLAAFVVVSTLPMLGSSLITAQAVNEDEYAIHGGCLFDVDVINDRGGFDHKGCYNDLASAKSAMQSFGRDAVVRSNASKSPAKIVAMVNGIVISNPYRTGARLSKYYMNSDFTGSSTYTQQYMQAKYNGTITFDTGNGNGSVALTMNGFEGYIPMANCDLVPVKFMEKGLPIILGGNNNEDPAYTIYPEMNKYVCGTDASGNKELYFYSYWGWSNSVADASQTNALPNRKGVSLAAADWMRPGTTYYSYNGYDFYTDMAMTAKAGTYYDYYQFLPLRTKSNITADDLDRYLISKGYGSKDCSAMAGEGHSFVDAQNKYGVNALMVYAMAIQESGYGTSNYAMNRNNLFGWNAVDSDPDKASYFSSVNQAVKEHMHTNLNGYLDVDDGRHFGMAIGNKGNGFNVCYASDAYWGINIAHYAYDIDKFVGFKDRYDYTLGVVNSDPSVYFTKTSTSNDLFYDIENPGGKNGGYFAKAYLVPLLSEENSKYKVQSSDHLINGQLTRATSYNGRQYSNGKNYDWNNYVAWINKDWVTTLHCGVPSDQVSVPETQPAPKPEIHTPNGHQIYDDNTIAKYATYELDRGVSDVKFNEKEHTLEVTGSAYINGVKALDGDVTHTLVVTNAETNESIEYVAESLYNKDMAEKFYAGYQFIDFRGTIDLDDLKPGNYTLSVKVTNAKYENGKEMTTDLRYNLRDQNIKFKNGDHTVRVFSDSLYRNRLTISNEVEGVDREYVNKPTDLHTTFGAEMFGLKNGHLFMNDAYALIRKADITKDLHPSVKLSVEDDKGNVTEFAGTMKDSVRDYASVLDASNDVSYASFDLDADLTGLPAGHYRLWLTISTDQYHDTFELYSFSNTNYSDGAGENTLELIPTDTRYRYEMNVR